MLVSVIVPVYNCEPYLPDCIESILKQTHHEIELILVDDGSTDDSLSVLKEYKERDDRILLFVQPNSGVSSARNRGLAAASGDYICIIDADDTIYKAFVATLLAEFGEAGIDFVYCSRMYNYDGKLISKSHRLKKGVYSIDNLLPQLIDDGTLSGILFGSACTAMYKHSIIKKNSLRFNERVSRNEDGLFTIQYCINIRCASVLSDKHLYINRRREFSSSASSFKEKDKFVLREALQNIYSAHGLDHIAAPQLLARRISEAFWDILYLSSKRNPMSAMEKIKAIRERLSTGDLADAYKYLNTKKMHPYKRLYCFLMKRRLAFLLYFGTRYVYSMLENKVRR